MVTCSSLKADSGANGSLPIDCSISSAAACHCSVLRTAKLLTSDMIHMNPGKRERTGYSNRPRYLRGSRLVHSQVPFPLDLQIASPQVVRTRTIGRKAGLDIGGKAAPIVVMQKKWQYAQLLGDKYQPS